MRNSILLGNRSFINVDMMNRSRTEGRDTLTKTYLYLFQNSSCVPPNYMANQSDINEKMRGILIDWLIEVLKILFADVVAIQ